MIEKKKEIHAFRTLPIQDREGWMEGDILLCVDGIGEGKSRIDSFHIATYDYPHQNPYHKAMHLYVVDEVAGISEGDVIVNDEEVTQANDEWDDELHDEWKKVIASTDASLGLSMINKESVAQFVVVQGNEKKLLVEMTEDYVSCHTFGWKEDCVKQKHAKIVKKH